MVWKLLIFSLAVLFVFSTTMEIAFAEVTYPSTSQRLHDAPTYCIISPTDATTAQKTNLEKLAIRSVSTWADKLQGFEEDDPLIWEMKSKVISAEDSTAGCDITINFEKKVSQKGKRSGFTILGIFYHSSQSIYISFQDMTLEKVFNILIHEIGHSIGLGHYVSDDNDENKKWYSGDFISPSIMIPTTNSDPSKMSIMDVDIFKVRSIYGASGFLPFISEPLPVPTPTPVPTPKPTPLPKPVPINPLNPFESIGISEDGIIVSKYDTKIVRISGQISDSVLHRGNSVYIVVKSSDDFVVHKIIPTESGYFELPLVFDVNSKKGLFEVEASYLEHTDTSMNFDFYVGDLPSPSVPKPQEVKPEVLPDATSGRYLENISISSEDNDYTVTSYLSEEFDTATSMKITAENECPKKKEVFQKDFLPSPGKKVSFSFFQLDNGKPDKCFIHFTVSDFNGNIMERIVKNYEVERQTQQNPVASLQNQKVPSWIKNNASWWSEGIIDDDSFIQGIQFLIKEDVLKISSTTQSSGSNEIPVWIKNNAKWWSEGLIGEEDFLKGIQYLVQQGIIRVI